MLVVPMSSINTTQYIRKPLYVAAVRLTARNFDAISQWCQGEIQQEEQPDKGVIKKYIKVRVHNPKNARQTKAFIGDWLLYTERGYKVYTNKAFHDSFDTVEEDGTVVATQKEPAAPQIPKFWIDPESGTLTESKPHSGAAPLTLTELVHIVRNELVDEELTMDPVEQTIGDVIEQTRANAVTNGKADETE